MRGSELAKRLLDLAIVAASAPVTIPLSVAAAVAIRAESKGGAIFRQTRVGRNGERFTVLKFRTMVENAENIGAGLYAEPNDPRFTRTGLIARRFSIDEVPQLWNVVRGEMSIVGPRPCLPQIVDRYPEEFAEILKVKPGLTGLSQVNGRNALVRSQRMALDSEYANSWSVLGDVGIILRTFSVVLKGEGQLNTQGEADVER